MNCVITEIEDLLPHQGNMVLLDRLIEITDCSALAEFSVKNNGLFWAAPDMPAWAGLELISQVAAAWAGYQAKQKNEPVKLGFLIGTRRYTAHVEKIVAGQTVQISAKQIHKDDSGMAVIEGRIFDDAGMLLVEANLNVYQPNVEQLTQMMERE